MKLTPGLNFINVLRTAFTPVAPKSVRIQSSCQYLFTLLGSRSAKAVRRTLMKLTPVVNFINVKRTNFSYERRISAAFSSYTYVEKRRSYEKFVRKMLMKLTPGFVNQNPCHILYRQQPTISNVSSS
jgi:hypothetical protein